MLSNYLKIAFRHLLRNRGHFFINITGLIVGFSAFMLIFLVIAYEQSFDSFHKNKDRIYRVVRINKQTGDKANAGGASFPLAGTLRSDYPQLEHTSAIYGDRDVQVIIPGPSGETLKKFKEPKGVFLAESRFFDLFDFPMIGGNPARAITEPNTALLTKDFAAKYFGDWENATGKIIKVYDQPIRITGVLDNPPPNTDFPLGLVISYPTILSLGIDMSDWIEFWNDHYCFTLLPPGHTAQQLNAQLPALISKHIPAENADYNLGLQPLNELHFDQQTRNFNHRTFSKALITVLRLIGIFLLVIACVNFINLSTASAISRAREVGIRKVLGSNHRQLLLQFFGETGLLCLIAMAGAMIIAFVCLPFLNELLDVKMSFGILNKLTIIGFLLATLVTVTLLSGFYPALVLSGFSPVNVLKNQMGTASIKGVTLRRVLVILQFGIAQVLIIVTLVVIAQLNYFTNADMGFSKEAIVSVRFPRDSVSQSRLYFIRQQLLQQPGISNISFSAFATAGYSSWATDLQLGSNNSSHVDMIVNMKPADTSYFSIYQLHIIAGRIYTPSDTMREFVVNETLVKKLALGSPGEVIGKMIKVMGSPGPIVGVVKDYHTNSLRDPISPVVMTTLTRTYRVANIKIAPGKVKASLAAIENIWSKVYPDYAFEYNFIDQTVSAYYKQEKQLSKLYKIFAGISIFISCLGLYGLVSFVANRRRKEIGIRKVLGAPVRSILFLLSREFMILIMIAFLIAAPVAWYFTQEWLQQYSFRIEVGEGFFLITFLSSILIAWLSVGHSTIKAALANPVKNLEY